MLHDMTLKITPKLASEAQGNEKIALAGHLGTHFAGVRRGKEHTPTDQRCADKGVFIVENLCNLKPLAAAGEFTAYTLPMNYGEMTGLPCRVVGEIESL